MLRVCVLSDEHAESRHTEDSDNCSYMMNRDKEDAYTRE